MYLSGNRHGNFVAELDGRIVGYCFTHKWGKTGWLGPLGVAPENQRNRIGSDLVLSGIDLLIKSDVSTLGLESIHQSNLNLSFYLKLGFIPAKLTLSLSRPVFSPIYSAGSISELEWVEYEKASNEDRNRLLRECESISDSISPGLEYLLEIERTSSFQFGTTLFFIDDGCVRGFAICHDKPYFQGNTVSVLRVKTLALRPGSSQSHLDIALEFLRRHAESLGCEYLQIGLSSHHWIWLGNLLTYGFRIDITNLRMIYPGYEENVPEEYALFSRWVG